MLVVESVERPTDLFVDEPVWSVERGNPTRKRPRYPKVPSPPGDLVAQAKDVGVSPADCALARTGHRRNMSGHRQRQIEGFGGPHREGRHAIKPNRHDAIITLFTRCLLARASYGVLGLSSQYLPAAALTRGMRCTGRASRVVWKRSP